MINPICRTAMKMEKMNVLSLLLLVRASSPNMAAPAPAPTPVVCQKLVLKDFSMCCMECKIFALTYNETAA